MPDDLGVAPYWLMPTPWPKPAPRMVKVEAAEAGVASASSAASVAKRVRGIRSGTAI
jgi:hypothetical protein